FTCEVREGTKDISWFGFEEFVVDGVILLYRIPFENMFERAVSVVKMRGIEHAQSIRALKIGKGGVKVFPELEPFHKAEAKRK
ncbi:MAG: RAD55 family ATPase, partial [Candidatus Aenigmatarchaeota archaeon]